MSQLLSDTARNRQVGIALVTVTTLMFAVLDTSAKWLVQSLPVLQVVWLRFVFHTFLTTAIFIPSMGMSLFKINNPRLQLLRGVMLALMTGLNFFALQYLQLAETGAVQFSVPILIALISAWLLHEKLDAKRWAAICIGFLGVLVIIRPGSNGFHPAIFSQHLQCFLVCGLQFNDPPFGQQRSPHFNATCLGGSAIAFISAFCHLVLANARRLVHVESHFAHRFNRWHRPHRVSPCTSLRYSRRVRPVFVSANHLHGHWRMASVRSNTRFSCGARGRHCGLQRLVFAMA